MNRRSGTTLGAVISVALIAALLLVAWLLSRPHPTPQAATSHATAAATHATSRSTARATATKPASERTDPATGLEWVDAADLPAQARDTLALIDKGGPFPYPNNDGVVFTNAEGHLPHRASGYYHEYTVPTPGSRDRGTRRIVTGGPGEYFYTGDQGSGC